MLYRTDCRGGTVQRAFLIEGRCTDRAAGIDPLGLVPTPLLLSPDSTSAIRALNGPAAFYAQHSQRDPDGVLHRATRIGLIARATPLHPPGAPEVDASRQPERRDRALSSSVATQGQAAVPDEAAGACSRSCRTSKPVPRSSDAAARRATVSDPDVALLSSPRSERPPPRLRATAFVIARARAGPSQRRRSTAAPPLTERELGTNATYPRYLSRSTSGTFSARRSVVLITRRALRRGLRDIG